MRLTLSKSLVAELPKIKLNPSMMVASGTKLARVFVGLKIRRHIKNIKTRDIITRTPSSFATAEETSYVRSLSAEDKK